MEWLQDLLSKPYSSQHKAEVERLLGELVQVGSAGRFPFGAAGSGFNSQCRNIRARQIGTRLNDVGGLPLMEYAQRYVRRKGGKKGKSLYEHLEYAWVEIGDWMK